MGGSKPSAPTYITPPPPQVIQQPATPLPGNTVAESSKQLFESQLQYNPQLAQQSLELQKQYGLPSAQNQVDVQTKLAPQMAQSQYDLQALLGPQYRQLYADLFPNQVQGQDLLAQQSLQRLQSPQGLTPDQLSAQDAIRGRAREQMTRNVRSSANVGGTLYGGHRQAREDRALGELEQGFAAQDIGLQDARRAQTLQELIASSQVVFPQVQQPGVPQGSMPQFTQGVTSSPDALLSAVMAQSGNNIINPAQYQPGQPGTPSAFGSFVRGYAGGPMGMF